MLSRALLILLLATAVQAAPRFYQRATVVHMNTVKCMAMQSDSRGVVGALFGQAQAAQAQNMYCSEYILQSERVLYRVQPRKGGDPLLLPIGDEVQFRMDKNHLLVRPEDSDREYEFNVVAMTLRSVKNAVETERGME